MTNKNIKEKKINQSIKDVIGGIMELAMKERKQSEGYKDLFEHDSIKGVLIKAEDDMVEIALNVVAVLEDKYKLKLLDEGYDMICMLPLLSNLIEKVITLQEGSPCCVDKTHYLISRIVKSKTKSI